MITGGEALTVVDPLEAWMFHIIPDNTGASAVWVAQRVPDGQFIIGILEVNIKRQNLLLIFENDHSKLRILVYFRLEIKEFGL